MSGASEKADEIVMACAKAARAMGAAQVIVLVGLPDDEHSAYAARYIGACLPVRGLLEIGAETIRAAIVWDENEINVRGTTRSA